jgi:hypothetical protein
MRREPPTGEELAELVSSVKPRVMKTASRTHQKRARLSIAGIAIVGSAILVVGGAGAAIATSSLSGTFHPIPHSTNRVSDPPAPSRRPQSDVPLQAAQASLDQLWAAANSEVGDNAGAGGVEGAGAGMADFSAAITQRCYPVLTPAEVGELENLKARFQSVTGAASLAPARAYFERATTLCM